jgi:two-component system LytT family response regulator
MAFRVLIADDEQLSRDYLYALAKLDARFEVTAVCESGLHVLDCASQSPLDVAFLDVSMPGLNGFQIAERLPRPSPLVVFVTAFSDFAVRAYDCGAIDYVTKPIDPSRFSQTLDRVNDRLHERDAAQTRMTPPTAAPGGELAAPPERRLLAGVRQDVVYTHSEIQLIQSQGNYVNVWINGEPCLVRESLDRFCSELDPSAFVRVHRSYVVNMRYVRAIRYERAGTAELTLADGFLVPVSRRHRNAVSESLRALMPRDR